MHSKLTLQMGGLLSLAGLSLLSQEARAADVLAPDLPPTPGTAQANDPYAVVVPEPSAQPTAPEEDNLTPPHPTWTPGVDGELVAAAEALSVTTTETAGDITAIAAPEVSPAASPAAPLEVTEAVAPESVESSAPLPIPPSAPETPAAAVAAAPAVAIAPASAPRPDSPALTELTAVAEVTAKVPGSNQGAIAAKPAPATEIGHSSEALLVPTQPVSAVTASAEATPPPAPASPTLEAVAPIAPTGNPSPTGSPRPSASGGQSDAIDMATLRARSAQIVTLLQDIRSTAGLETSPTAPLSEAKPAPARQVSPPETQGRSPQLPPLPGARRVATAGGKPSPAGVAQPEASSAPSATLRPAREPQLPVLPTTSHRAAAHPEAAHPETVYAASNVALALPVPQPVLSSTVGAGPVSPAASPGPATAQATPSPGQPGQIQDDLRIPPLTTAANPARTYLPSPNAGIPSAFGANWGDVFISASLAGADRLRPEADGSLSMGFGLGDSQEWVGVELAYNLLSVRNFGQNGSFDVKVHREVYDGDQTQVAAAVGVGNALSYGSNTVDTAASLYGVVTAAHLLQPDHPTNRLPITATVGLGGGNFAADNTDVGVIAGVGLQVHPQFSLNTAWSGVGLNVGASILPDVQVPLSINLLYGDIGNNTPAGSVAVISIGYGYSSAPRF